MENDRTERKNAFALLALIFASAVFACIIIQLALVLLYPWSEYDPNAVTYMILQIVTFITPIPFSILAIVFGILGLNRERRRHDRHSVRNKVFSIIGIAVGVLAFVTLFILIPAL